MNAGFHSERDLRICVPVRAVNSFSANKLWRISLIIVAALLGAGLVCALFITDSHLQMIVGDTVTTLAAIYGTVACFYAAKCCKPIKGVMKAWIWIAAAMTCWIPGNGLYSYYEIVLREAPFPSPADIFFIAYYPAFVLGLLQIRKFRQCERARPKAMIEMMIAFVAGMLGLGRLIIAPLIARENSTPVLTTVLATAYPAMDLAIIWALVGLVVRPNSLRDPVTLYLLAGGGLAMTVADCFFGYQNLLGTWQSGQFMDSLFALSLCLTGLAGVRMARMAPLLAALPPMADRSDDAEALAEAANPWTRYVPLTIVTVVLLSIAWLVGHTVTPAFAFLFGGSLLIVGLVFARMLMAVRENNDLFRRYHMISEGLKERTTELEFAHCELQIELLRRGELERERREMEGKMLQMQKLESLGVLAGGIAHDFNNLLTAMLGNIGVAKLELPEKHAAVQFLSEAERITLRAADLTQQMLAFSGKGGLAVGAVCLNAVAEEMSGLLKASISKKISVSLKLAPNLPSIEADSTQLQQVLMNLILNAAESMEGRSGTITVRTRAINADEKFLSRSALPDTLPPGRYVLMHVTDEGVGMSPETLARIFEPFFTTKFTGRGLGLAATLGIVRGHRGVIFAESTEGVGTRFTVGFPAVNAEVAKPVVEQEVEEFRGDQTILVVDDETLVRDVTTRMLKGRGFRTIAARDGQEAVSIFEQQNGDIDAVLLDLTMPVMGGEEAFAQIQRINPDVPVIVTSGYAESTAGSRFGDGTQPKGFIQKPFNAQMLTDALREALN
jgi:signal transduction histidine kinase/CheY-like chemotaxis protein